MKERRILLYGVTGSGKTSLAERVSRATGIPWHSVDDLTWMPGWQEVPLDEQKRKLSAVCSCEEWILDTAYAKWSEIPLARAEIIVGLDYPRWVSFGRLLKRTLQRAIDGKPICNGNRETWKLMFSKDSILIWHFKSFKRKRQRLNQWLEEGRNVVLLRSPRETERWLSNL